MIWGGPNDPQHLSWHFLRHGTGANRDVALNGAPGPDPARIQLPLDGRTVVVVRNADSKYK